MKKEPEVEPKIQKEKKPDTKLCKYCQTEIPKKAKVCPNCKKSQGNGCLGTILLVIGILIILLALVSMFGGSDDTDGSTSSGTSGTSSTASSTSSSSEDEVEEIEYISATVTEMMDLLDKNALNASDTYEDQYIEVTGRLGVIDSSGNYIALYPSDNEWAIIGVTCYIKSDEQLDIVKTMETGDTVTVRGKCTNVGEVIGYSLNITEIVQE